MCSSPTSSPPAAYLAQAAFFRTAGAYTVRLAHTPRRLLAAVTGISALLSATGNPQNMLIQGASGLSYASFAAYMALPAILLARAGAVLHAGGQPHVDWQRGQPDRLRGRS